jgi:hypothetical protein
MKMESKRSENGTFHPQHDTKLASYSLFSQIPISPYPRLEPWINSKMTTAGPSRPPRRRDTWQPSRYLEPNHPDNEEVMEQASYQAAITRQGASKVKLKARRTVEYMGTVMKWRQVRVLFDVNGGSGN